MHYMLKRCIIIMQRRKILSNVKPKPKLVLQRDKCPSSLPCPSIEAPPISAVKLHENKENKTISSKQQENHSLQVRKDRSQQKRTHFNVRYVNPIKTEHTSQKSFKMNQHLSGQDHHSNSLQLSQFLQRTVRQITYSPQVFQFSGDLTLSSSLLSKILRTVMEETTYNALTFHNINAKLNIIFQNREGEDKKQDGKEKVKEEKVGWRELSFHQCFSYQFPEKFSETESSSNQGLRETEVSLESNLPRLPSDSQSLAKLAHHSNQQPQPSKHEETSSQLAHEAVSSSNKFIFQHLGDLDNYILNQPNKILHQAIRRHKYLEEELFAYADFLTISKVGIRTYTPQVNICAIQSNLDREMRQINRSIIQGDHPIDKKCKIMRDFVLRIRESFNTIIVELMQVIDKKTAQSKIFVDKVTKWQENYLTRKEYLSNLKKDYCREIHSLTLTLNTLRHSSDPQSLKNVSRLQQGLASIDRIFLMGNSFY